MTCSFLSVNGFCCSVVEYSEWCWCFAEAA